jgi:hypothetical protein
MWGTSQNLSSSNDLRQHSPPGQDPQNTKQECCPPEYSAQFCSSATEVIIMLQIACSSSIMYNYLQLTLWSCRCRSAIVFTGDLKGVPKFSFSPCYMWRILCFISTILYYHCCLLNWPPLHVECLPIHTIVTFSSS